MEKLFVGEYVWHNPKLAAWALEVKEYEAQNGVTLVMALTYLAATYASNMLGQITTTGLFMSIHSASPGTTGANELAGGTAYTGNRPAISWGSVTTGVVISNDTQTYPMLLTEAGGIPYFGLWTASTAGTYLFGGPTSGLSGSIPSGANVTFTNGVTLTQAG